MTKRLHKGVVGAHTSQGGRETPQADLDADDRRFGPEAQFMQGPNGRDSMSAGPLTWKEDKPHVDTEPYLRRPASQGEQLPLGTEGAFRPNDPVQHFVRLKHPHLQEDYHFEKGGDDERGHTIDIYHRGTLQGSGGPMTGRGRAGTASDNHVGFMRWSGKRGTAETAPGEIEGISVHPQHQGKGLSTALWDYAQAHTALHQTQGPVHSKDRSTAGNHWAHFVGGASMARTEGHETPEYFENQWRT